jgi:hypothetical protein
MALSLSAMSAVGRRNNEARSAFGEEEEEEE